MFPRKQSMYLLKNIAKWSRAYKALTVLFSMFGAFSALADGENFTFPVAHLANDKYTARLHDGTKNNTVSWGNKVKLTVLQGKVFAVTANEMIVARRTLKFKIEPIPLNGWQTTTDPYEETRDLRNNNNGNVFNNFTGVSFIEDHTDPDDGMMNGWEWIVPYVRVADLQIDSLNENPYGGVSGSDEEDAQEDTDSGGKILGCNVQSYSPGSGKPGWADFSAAPASQPPFATMHLFLQGFPSSTQVRFQYSGSDPSQITQDNNGNWQLPQNGGCLRVWTKNVYQARSLSDYIAPNTAYSFEDLKAKQAQVADGHLVFYVEAVKGGSSPSDNQVTVEVKTPGSSWVPLDTVRLIPFELKVHQDEGHQGPQGSGRVYKNSPFKESIASNLFALWPNETATIKIKGLEDIIGSLPVGFIEWTSEADGASIEVSDDKLDAEVSWNSPCGNAQGYTVTAKIGEASYDVVFNVPDVGNIDEIELPAFININLLSALNQAKVSFEQVEQQQSHTNSLN